MITVFVLNVREFHSIATVASSNPAIRVTAPNKLGYYRLDSEGELRMNRRVLGLKPAVWHGILTGGFIGRIVQFDNDELVIVGEDAE